MRIRKVNLRRNATRGLLGAATAVAATTLLPASPAGATEYSPGLCSAGDNRRTISPTYIWGAYDRILNTSDFAGTEWSFRTCSWLGTNHNYFYSCSQEVHKEWRLNIVGREPHGGGEVIRRDFAVSCNSQLQGVTWPTSHWPNSDIHYHLWSPSETGCSACGEIILDWGASVK